MPETPDRPVPVPDADSQAWWDAISAGRLLYQRCQTCGHHQLYVRAMCKQCWSRETTLEESSGQGTVYSYSIVERTGDPAFRGRVPYMIALVELAEGPRVLAQVDASDLAAVEVGDDVRATFVTEGTQTLLHFEPTRRS